MLNLIHGHLKWTTQVGAGNTLRNDTTFSHRDRGTSSQLHTAHALEDMRECLAATGKESWPGGGAGRGIRKGQQDTASAPCRPGQWQQDLMCLRLRPDKMFFRVSVCHFQEPQGHPICSILVACLGFVCWRLSEFWQRLTLLCSPLPVWLVLSCSTTCLRKNYSTGGWPHAKTQLGNWLSRGGCELNPASTHHSKQRRGML